MSLSLLFFFNILKYKWAGFKFLNEWSMTSMCYLILIICALTATYMGAFRWRVMAIGPFFDNSHELVTIDSPSFFKNFYLPPKAINVIQQISVAIQHNHQILVENIFGPEWNAAHTCSTKRYANMVASWVKLSRRKNKEYN